MVAMMVAVMVVVMMMMVMLLLWFIGVIVVIIIVVIIIVIIIVSVHVLGLSGIVLGGRSLDGIGDGHGAGGVGVGGRGYQLIDLDRIDGPVRFQKCGWVVLNIFNAGTAKSRAHRIGGKYFTSPRPYVGSVRIRREQMLSKTDRRMWYQK